MAVKRQQPSEAEIAVLEALALEGESLAIQRDGKSACRLRLLLVDPAREFLVLGSSGEASRDRSLVEQQSLELCVEWGEWRIAFSADRPEPASHQGVSAIRVAFPESLSIKRRRLHERAEIPESAPLRCFAHSGTGAIFEAIVTNVSQGGVGLQLDFAGASLEPGMVLPGCRLEAVGSAPAIVDLEIRHTTMTTLPDGRRVSRAGCRFANLSAEAAKLVARYVAVRPQAD